ncbi:class I adenylate-forming enzyme family protein [Saliphagus infecundisoli]|uniref:Class I adenylate-forming enzyme family protein n=1 Tax=Saliphagus infecundisoli TaxID=1849069 RepID=A0ABD5QFX8_9EURY|nr:class I adenylate-forming enzyme family protein [Saliphagus infecundisoli]
MRKTPDWPTTDPVAHRREATPNRTALTDAAGESWDYREYDRRVETLRRSPALDPGARIAVLLPARPAFALLPFAAMRAGASLVLLPTRETVPELAAKAHRAGVDAVVCGDSTEETSVDLAESAGVPAYSVDEPTRATVEALTTGPVADGPRDRPPLEPDRTLLIAFTSGTGGEPKGVRLTAGNLLASAQASAYRLGVVPGDRWLSPLAMYHVGGLAPAIRCALYGTTVVIDRGFDADRTPEVIDREGVTCLSLVPTMLRRLLEAGWTPPDSLRFVLLGGAPAAPTLLERAGDADVTVCPTYGMTEAASQVATASPAEDPLAQGVGQPLYSASVSIVGHDGEPVAPGEVGEVVVDGPMVTPGYLDDDRTEEAFGPRGLATGDVGTRDAEGYLRIAGRRSDRIVTGGENVDPGEVSRVLEAHSAVAEAAVVGLADPEWSERVGALIVPRGEAPTSGELCEHYEDRLAGFKHPRTVVFADSLPRTASGTVDREAVRDRLESAGTRPEEEFGDGS